MVEARGLAGKGRNIIRPKVAAMFRHAGRNPVWMIVLVLMSMALQASAATRKELEAALSKTEAALKNAEVRGDVAFIMTQGARLTGRKFTPILAGDILQNKNDGGLQELEYAFWQRRNVVFPVLAKGKITRDTTVGFNPPVMRTREWGVRQALALMAKVVKCQGKTPMDAMVGPLDYEYVATHQLLTILFGAQKGCFTTASLQKQTPKYVQRVYSEMLLHVDEPTDIQVERAAFLVLYGRTDLIPDLYIDNIVKSQSDDGLWYFGYPPAHTSALAYLLLSAAYAKKT